MKFLTGAIYSISTASMCTCIDFYAFVFTKLFLKLNSYSDYSHIHLNDNLISFFQQQDSTEILSKYTILPHIRK